MPSRAVAAIVCAFAPCSGFLAPVQPGTPSAGEERTRVCAVNLCTLIFLPTTTCRILLCCRARQLTALANNSFLVGRQSRFAANSFRGVSVYAFQVWGEDRGWTYQVAWLYLPFGCAIRAARLEPRTVIYWSRIASSAHETTE